MLLRTLLLSLLLAAAISVVAQRNPNAGPGTEIPSQQGAANSALETSFPSSGPDVSSLITPKILAAIPERATDASGQPSGVVNILIVGSEEELKRIFEAGQWTVVGRAKAGEKKDDSSQNQSERTYLDMPLPELFLFGKPQDYGFVYPEPVTVYQTRRYLRVWKAPLTVSNQTLWVGAAAHDDGPWWDDRTGEVNHQPNPNVDAERTFVGESLNSTGLVAQLGYVQAPGGPAAAGPLGTDGRILLLKLTNLPSQ